MMMIYDDIKNYAKQFEFEPQIQHAAKLAKRKKFIVCGMGGSHLAADLLKAWHPELDMIVWSNYGLPPMKDADLKERLVIISSHSGNTEEELDAFQLARKKKLAMAVIAAHGKLIVSAE